MTTHTTFLGLYLTIALKITIQVFSNAMQVRASLLFYQKSMIIIPASTRFFEIKAGRSREWCWMNNIHLFDNHLFIKWTLSFKVDCHWPFMTPLNYKLSLWMTLCISHENTCKFKPTNVHWCRPCTYTNTYVNKMGIC